MRGDCSLPLTYGAQLVFIDNAAHVFAGNENARHDVAAFLGLLERLSIEIDGAVILLAHPNKQHSQGNKQGNEYSGTTGWSAHVRNRLFLDWESGDAPNPDGRVLRRSKANYARKGEEIEFIWHDWAFTRIDDLQPSLASQIRDVSRQVAENEIFLACLDKAAEEKRTVSPSKAASNYAPRVFAKMPTGKGIKVSGFEAAMQRLLHMGTIQNDQPVYKRGNRTWAHGLGRAQTPAQTMHKPGAQTCTEADGKPADDLHTGAHAPVPITKVIDGAASGAAAPSDDETDF